jgi:hypothetical protein
VFSRWPIRRRVLVNTEERAFDGVLWCKTGSILVLKDVTLVEPDTEPVKLDGDVIVERAQVQFIQVR